MARSRRTRPHSLPCRCLVLAGLCSWLWGCSAATWTDVPPPYSQVVGEIQVTTIGGSEHWLVSASVVGDSIIGHQRDGSGRTAISVYEVLQVQQKDSGSASPGDIAFGVGTVLILGAAVAALAVAINGDGD